MKQVRELKGWIEGCEAVSRSVDDLNVLFDFAKEGEATEEEVDTHYAETLQLVEELVKRAFREAVEKGGGSFDA